LKNDKPSTSQSLSKTFVLVFYAISETLGTVVDRDTLMSTLGINRDRCFFMVIIEENPALYG